MRRIATASLLFWLAAVTNGAVTASPIAPAEKGPKPPPTPVQEALAAARLDLLGGRLSECREELERARKADPELPPVDLLIGRIWLQTGRTANALRGLEEAALSTPDHPELFASFGDLAALTGRPSDARVQYERALAAPTPENWSAKRQSEFRREIFQRLGGVTENRQQWSQALKTYQAWFADQPDELDAVAGIARCQAALGEIEAALAGFAKVHEQRVTAPRPNHALALALHRAGKVAEAEEYLRKVFAEAPDVATARADYISLLLVEDRPEEALTQWNLLPPGTLGDRRAKFLRGLIARYLEDRATAESVFGELHRRNPQDWQAADQLALVLIDQPDEGKRGRALQLADTNLRNAPDRATALATAGWLRLRLGEMKLASQLLDESAVTGGMTAQLAYYLAEHRHANAREEEAAAFREQMVRLPGLCVQRGKVRTELSPKGEP